MACDPLEFQQFADWCDAAREFNEWVSAERVRAAAPAPSDARGDRPGDLYNRLATWTDILSPHGWQVDRTSGQVSYWTRPGKSRGCSATTGKCSSDQSGDLLYVFSSNADPFEPETAYDKFGAYSRLEHSGDFETAARDLAAKGYTTTTRPEAVGPPPVAGEAGEAPDDGIAPDHDFATNADLKVLGLGLKWAWDGWLQMGAVNLLAAEAGIGKTRFIADLVRRVHIGDRWPDGADVPKWDSQYLAMWVAADSNHGELLELSETFGFGDRIAYSGSKANPIGGTTLDTMPDFVALHQKVKAAHPLFLVVDTAGGATSKNLAKQEEARAFYAPLAVIAARRQICVVVITHLNASKTVLGRRSEERVRSVIRMSAASREQDVPRRIEVVKTNAVFPAPLGMKLGATGNSYDFTPPPKPEDQPAPGFGGGSNEGEGGQKNSKTRECMDWLGAFLETKSYRVSDLRKLGEDKGFSAKRIYEAKSLLGLEEFEMQGYKWWRFPVEGQAGV